MEQISKVPEELAKLREMIKEHKDIALSDSDVLEIVKGQANVILNRNLDMYKTIDEVLEPYNAAFILYESSPKYGHWTCLTKFLNKEGKQEIEFFDPYGGFPDTMIEFIPEPFLTESGQNKKYLSELLINCSDDYELSYNEFKFQKLDKSVKSCGRWCCMRIMMKTMPLAEFKDLFLNVYSDDLVTAMTSV